MSKFSEELINHLNASWSTQEDSNILRAAIIELDKRLETYESNLELIVTIVGNVVNKKVKTETSSDGLCNCDLSGRPRSMDFK